VFYLKIMYIINLIVATYLYNANIISQGIFILVIFELIVTSFCCSILFVSFKYIKTEPLFITAVIMICFYIYNLVYCGLIMIVYYNPDRLGTDLHNMSIAIMVTNSLGIIGWVPILLHIHTHSKFYLTF